MDKNEIMNWKSIGYDAQSIVCISDINPDIEKVRKLIYGMQAKTKKLCFTHLDNIYREYGISVTEYLDNLAKVSNKDDVNIQEIKNHANAVLQMIVDMSYGTVKKHEYYKRMAEEYENVSG